MNSERPAIHGIDQTGASGSAAGPGSPCYVKPAELLEVMWDQLEYLARHRDYGCLPGCMDCTRLNQVQNWLLLPFRTTIRRKKAKGR
jgi:hypothetical protein